MDNLNEKLIERPTYYQRNKKFILDKAKELYKIRIKPDKILVSGKSYKNIATLKDTILTEVTPLIDTEVDANHEKFNFIMELMRYNNYTEIDVIGFCFMSNNKQKFRSYYRTSDGRLHCFSLFNKKNQQ